LRAFVKNFHELKAYILPALRETTQFYLEAQERYRSHKVTVLKPQKTMNSSRVDCVRALRSDYEPGGTLLSA
jgi:hypothetical protein